MTPEEERQRDARNAVVWEVTEELRAVNGRGITVRDRGHAAALLDAWEHIPIDGSDYEWSTILAATTRYLLDYPTAQTEAEQDRQGHGPGRITARTRVHDVAQAAEWGAAEQAGEVDQ